MVSSKAILAAALRGDLDQFFYNKKKECLGCVVFLGSNKLNINKKNKHNSK
jgi:hypothetical protein